MLKEVERNLLKVIIDTNIFIDALSDDMDSSYILYREYMGEFQLYCSNAMTEELLHVYKHETFPNRKYQKGYVLEIMYRWIRTFRRSMPVNTTKRLNIIKADPSDNMFLECASESEAEIIVTSDAHFNIAKGKIFNINNKAVEIYSKSEFLELLDKVKRDKNNQVAIGE